jgi:hypothetical protein
VADETDRLLRQSYQEWLPQVLARLAGSGGSSSGRAGGGLAVGRVVKLVVSATLTRTPPSWSGCSCTALDISP